MLGFSVLSVFSVVQKLLTFFASSALSAVPITFDSLCDLCAFAVKNHLPPPSYSSISMSRLYSSAIASGSENFAPFKVFCVASIV